MPELTKEQLLYIKEHPYESQTKMARMFGCARPTVCRHLNNFFGNSYIQEKQRRRDEIYRIVRELYPTHTSVEIAKMTGLTLSQINNVARRAGVRHTADTYERIKAETLARLNSRDVKEKRIRKVRQTYMADKFRAKSGMRQRTRVRFGRNITNAEGCIRKGLVHRYGYVYDREYGDLFALFYNSETKRLPEERERHYSEKYNFKFLPMEE